MIATRRCIVDFKHEVNRVYSSAGGNWLSAQDKDIQPGFSSV